MNRKISLIIILSVASLLILQSCGKDWLNAKPDKSLVVPGSIKDFQALLDNTTQTFNVTQASGLGEISAGDFYLLYNSWQSLFNVQEKSAYIWAETSDFYKGEKSIDWVNAYTRILNSNIVLDGIEKIKPTINEKQNWANVKGAALFFRAFDFFNLSQEYCKSYVQSTASTDLGLPLRLEYDVNIEVKRANLQQTYDQIIKDLKSASYLLNTNPLYKTRPSKQAAFGLLARTYLSMELYEQAGLYADSALQIQHDLINYAELNTTIAFPITRFNPEVIFQSTFTYGTFNASRLIVDPTLYATYTIDDCRKSLFFTPVSNGGVTYKGSYNGDRNLFGGLATDEMYLIRAESNVRVGKLLTALVDINYLLRNRWKNSYSDLLTSDPDIALSYILMERRKELIFRGLRWTDLRRLNRDKRFAVILTRSLNGQNYTLLPNDKKYVFPIDEEELRLSGIQQNER